MDITIRLNPKYLKVALVGLVFLGTAALLIATTRTPANAEHVGGSPNNDPAVSRIKSLYTTLQGDSYGSDTDTPDWGATWNRIKTSATWVPAGTVATADVRSGRTFYGSSRTQQTGTYPAPGACASQQYHDSYGPPVTQTTNCTDTVAWATASPAVTGDDKQDPRTGLVWSQLLLNSAGTPTFSAGSNSTWNWDGTLVFTVTSATATAGATYTNNGQTFTVITSIASGTSLNVTATGSPQSSGTLTKASGTGDATITFSALAAGSTNVAVGSKTAKQLCSDRGNGWRLPSQKELMQAYIDGSYFNLSQPSNNFWSATENSSTNAWSVALYNGYTNYYPKSTNLYQVRCVR